MKARRIELLRKITSDLNTDEFMVYSPQWHRENYRFLTGEDFIRPSEVILYPAEVDETYVIYRSNWDQYESKPLLDEVHVHDTDPHDTMARLPREAGVKNLTVFGKEHIPLDSAQAAGLAGTTCIPGEGRLETARMQKTEEEIGYLGQAVSLMDQARTVSIRDVVDGLSEYQIVAEIEHYTRRHNTGDYFILLVTDGDEVHGMTSPMMHVAQLGQMVRTEVTSQISGWQARICRTCIRGGAGDSRKKASGIFLEIEQIGFDMIRPGVNIRDVAKAENDVFRRYGYGEYHAEKHTRVRGHGHRLDLDEMPLALESADLVLRENMVAVIHPNTFNPLCGYMVLGDPVLIAKDGYEPLSVMEHKLFEVQKKDYMEHGYMGQDKNLLLLSTLERRRQVLMEAAARADAKTAVVYGSVYSADELSYYMNYTPYWRNSAAVITEHEVYMVTGHDNHVNPWIHTSARIEEEKLLASGFKAPARTAQSLKERFPQGGQIGVVGTHAIADLAAAFVEQGFELVVMDDIKAELLQTVDEPYRETAVKAVGILRHVFKQGGEEYTQGGDSKTMTVEVGYTVRRNSAIDIMLYVSHREEKFRLPVTPEDVKGRWVIYGLMQYLGVWVSLTKTFGIDTNKTGSQLETAAVKLVPGAEMPHGTGSAEVTLRHITSDTVSDPNQSIWGATEGQVLSVEVFDSESGIRCSNIYRITGERTVVL